ncbi:ras GEF, partial [Neocallimastix californiae]
MNISYLDDIHIFDELDSKRNILFDNHNKHSSNGEHSKILIAGTVYKLIQYLTSTIDYGFVIDFLLTYRFFLTSYQLGRLLITRYRWALTGEETQEKKKVRIRLFVVLRKWITQFWDVDFKNNKDLVDLILIFMKDINHLPFIQDSIYDKKINDTLYYLIIEKFTSFSFETVNDNNIEYNGSSSKIHTQSKGSSGNILRKNSLFQHISGKNSGSKSFVLAIRSEDFAQQCCLIEQVLLRRVHWTELLNIENWTKIKENKEKKNLSILSMGKKGKNKNNDTSIIINSKGQDKNNDNELGITCIIERFNDVSHWVASEILRTSSIELRAKLIGKFIRIAQKCYHMNNYCTLNQIIYGLQNTYVERLKRTWTKVSNNEKNIYKKLVEFTNPFSNFKHVREAM